MDLLGDDDQMADDGFPAAAPSSASSFAVGSATATSGSGALAAFNTSFRAAGEAHDAKERDLKASRRAAGKQQLKKMLLERKTVVDARKAKNREEEAATEQAMLDALQGESWSRVVSLVDVHAAGHGSGGAASTAAAGSSAAAAATAGGGAASAAKAGKGSSSSGGSGGSAVGCTERMKDILLQLKARPLPVG